MKFLVKLFVNGLSLRETVSNVEAEVSRSYEITFVPTTYKGQVAISDAAVPADDAAVPAGDASAVTTQLAASDAAGTAAARERGKDEENALPALAAQAHELLCMQRGMQHLLPCGRLLAMQQALLPRAPARIKRTHEPGLTIRELRPCAEEGIGNSGGHETRRMSSKASKVVLGHKPAK